MRPRTCAAGLSALSILALAACREYVPPSSPEPIPTMSPDASGATGGRTGGRPPSSDGTGGAAGAPAMSGTPTGGRAGGEGGAGGGAGPSGGGGRAGTTGAVDARPAADASAADTAPPVAQDAGGSPGTSTDAALPADTAPRPAMDTAAPPPPQDANAVTPDSAQFSFESGTQGWTDMRQHMSGVTRSQARAFRGVWSLEASLDVKVATQERIVGVGGPSGPRPMPGALVTFRVWVPAGVPIAAIQPYVLDRRPGADRWTGTDRAGAAMTVNAWNVVPVRVPADAGTIIEVGVQVRSSAPWAGKIYIDSVEW